MNPLLLSLLETYAENNWAPGQKYLGPLENRNPTEIYETTCPLYIFWKVKKLGFEAEHFIILTIKTMIFIYKREKKKLKANEK